MNRIPAMRTLFLWGCIAAVIYGGAAGAIVWRALTEASIP